MSSWYLASGSCSSGYDRPRCFSTCAAEKTIRFAGSKLETRNWKLLLAPADKVHNLQTIAVLESCLWPLRAGDDLAIEFNGDAVALHSELLDQFCQRQGVGKAFFVAIDE